MHFYIFLMGSWKGNPPENRISLWKLCLNLAIHGFRNSHLLWPNLATLTIFWSYLRISLCVHTWFYYLYYCTICITTLQFTIPYIFTLYYRRMFSIIFVNLRGCQHVMLNKHVLSNITYMFGNITLCMKLINSTGRAGGMLGGGGGGEGVVLWMLQRINAFLNLTDIHWGAK